MVSVNPKAAGCLVTKDDIGRLCASLSAYCSQLGCGSFSALIGIALPILAKKLNAPVNQFSEIFTYSGLGYMLGIVLSTKLLESSVFAWSKTVVSCICINIAAACSIFIIVANTLPLLQIAFFFQFMSLGGVDTFSTIALSETWGQRVQPWMQTKSAVYALASVIPSLLVKDYGLTVTYYISSALCATSVLGAVGEYIYVYSMMPSTNVELQHHRPTSETSPLIGFYAHSHTSSKNMPLTRCGTSNVSFRGSVAGSDGPANMDDGVVSTELLTLENTLDAILCHPHPLHTATEGYEDYSTGDLGIMSPTKVVRSVLDATEYCAVSEERRQDPTFEPEINRTLAFATPRIVEGLSLISRRDSFRSPSKLPPAFIAPTFVKYMLAVFMFTDLGLASSISGWLPTYVSMVTLDVPMDGARIVSVYFGCAAVGCLLSVPLAVCVSTSTLLRIHLGLVIAAVFVLAGFYHGDANSLIAGVGIFGYALSAVIPLGLTMVNDYGYTMDGSSTGLCIIGAALGSAVVPNLLGSLMYTYGPETLFGGYSLLGCVLVCLYVVLHVYLHRRSKLPTDTTIPTTVSNGNGVSLPEVNSHQYASTVLERASHRLSAANLASLVTTAEGTGSYADDDGLLL